MKNKKRNITVYTDGNVRKQTQLTVQVDDAGDEWLNPDQVDLLVFMHSWARYECSNPLRASSLIVQSWQLAQPATATRSSDLSRDLVRSTPAFGML